MLRSRMYGGVGSRPWRRERKQDEERERRRYGGEEAAMIALQDLREPMAPQHCQRAQQQECDDKQRDSRSVHS